VGMFYKHHNLVNSPENTQIFLHFLRFFLQFLKVEETGGIIFESGGIVVALLRKYKKRENSLDT